MMLVSVLLWVVLPLALIELVGIVGRYLELKWYCDAKFRAYEEWRKEFED